MTEHASRIDVSLLIVVHHVHARWGAILGRFQHQCLLFLAAIGQRLFFGRPPVPLVPARPKKFVYHLLNLQHCLTKVGHTFVVQAQYLALLNEVCELCLCFSPS